MIDTLCDQMITSRNVYNVSTRKKTRVMTKNSDIKRDLFVKEKENVYWIDVEFNVWNKNRKCAEKIRWVCRHGSKNKIQDWINIGLYGCRFRFHHLPVTISLFSINIANSFIGYHCAVNRFCQGQHCKTILPLPNTTSHQQLSLSNFTLTELVKINFFNDNQNWERAMWKNGP